MAGAISSPADVVNLALSRMGYRRRISNLFDGSDAANRFLDAYGQTLDTCLRDGEWGFSQRMINGTLLKEGPQNYFDAAWDPTTMPPMPWQFEYAVPDDYIKIRSIRPQPAFPLDMTPTPTLFNVINDNGYTPPRRTIVCNVPSAIIVYTARVTDPQQWSADFVEVLASALERRMAAAIIDMGAQKAGWQDELFSARQASTEQG